MDRLEQVLFLLLSLLENEEHTLGFHTWKQKVVGWKYLSLCERKERAPLCLYSECYSEPLQKGALSQKGRIYTSPYGNIVMHCHCMGMLQWHSDHMGLRLITS